MEKNKKRFLLSVYFQDIFAVPLALALISLKVNPNAITMLGLVFSLVSAYFYLQESPVLGSLLFIICLILDSTDGRVARGLNKFSSFGAMLDSLADKVRSFIVTFVIIYVSIDNLELSLVAFAYVCLLPLYRLFFYDYSDNPKDPIQLFWESTPLRSWLDRHNLVGLYNGWERAVVVCVIAPLTPFPIYVIFCAVFIEQILFGLGLLIRKRNSQ